MPCVQEKTSDGHLDRPLLQLVVERDATGKAVVFRSRNTKGQCCAA